MNLKDNKSSGELKQEVLNELNNVNRDLDRMQGRLTPGQFIDDALFTPVGRNPRAVYDHLLANPIGTAFLGLGTFLLMENDSHVTYESQVKTRSQSVLNSSRDQIDVMKSKVAGVNGKIHGVMDRTKEKIDRSKEKISGLKDKINAKKDDFTTTGEYDLTQGGELGAGSISAKMDTVKNIDPMTFAAIGAGLGALTGIALPVSEKEQTLIDQKMGNQMSGLSSEFQDAINQSVRVLKDEFLGKFSDFDVSVFGRKNMSSGANETYRSDSQI